MTFGDGPDKAINTGSRFELGPLPNGAWSGLMAES